MDSGSSSTTGESSHTNPELTPQTTWGSLNDSTIASDSSHVLNPEHKEFQQQKQTDSPENTTTIEAGVPESDQNPTKILINNATGPHDVPSLDEESKTDGSDDGIEAEMPPEEDQGKLEYDTLKELRSSVLARSLEERKLDAPKRVLQVAQYTKLMEDRISFLETEFEKLMKQTLGVGSEENPDDASSVASDIGSKASFTEELTPLKLGWEKFTKEAATSKHVLVILNEDPALIGSHHVKETTEAMPKHIADASSNKQVERIRINSTVILNTISSWMSKDLGPTTRSPVMIRPFKLLLAYESKIREEVDILTKELSNLPLAESQALGSQELQVDDSQLDDEYKTSNSTAEERERAWDLKMKNEKLAHLSCLLTFVDEDLVKEKAVHQNLRQKSTTKVAFKDLWHLFVPGDVVIANDQRQAYRVLGTRGGRPLLSSGQSVDQVSDDERSTPSSVAKGTEGVPKRTIFRTVNPFTVDCFRIDFDGKEFGPVEKAFDIQPYDGEQEIIKLNVFPVHYLPENGKTKLAELLARGNKFRDLANINEVSHRSYKGASLVDEHGELPTRDQIDSEIIIDFEHAFLTTSRIPLLGLTAPLQSDEREILDGSGICYCGDPTCTIGKDKSRTSNYDDRKFDLQAREDFLRRESSLEHLTTAQKLTDDHLLLLPGAVYGYVLRNLKTYSLAIDLIKPVERGHAKFNDLVLPPLHKHLVESLVSSHSTEPHHGPDLQRGKGQGIIILLHGVPGVGKTSTAECVAERTSKPLFPITCGNIGVTASEVEKQLAQMFYLAHKWNCVMLLDEADVFLQARDNENMERNAVVSVFLRALEYYSGILFLTTNKVGKFDEAFKSRIHISLYYPPLGSEATLAIWTVNLDNIRKHLPDVVLDEDKILDYAWEHFHQRKKDKLVPWDGRQIRNAFQTALALAEFDQGDGKAVKLTKYHFEKVTQASEDFDQYLQDTRGVDDLDWAKDKQERNDKSKRLQMKSNGRYGATPTRVIRSAHAPVEFDNSSMSTVRRNPRHPDDDDGVRPSAASKQRPLQRGNDEYDEDYDNDGRDHARPTIPARPRRHDQNEDDLEPRQRLSGLRKSNRRDDDDDDVE